MIERSRKGQAIMLPAAGIKATQKRPCGIRMSARRPANSDPITIPNPLRQAVIGGHLGHRDTLRPDEKGWHPSSHAVAREHG